jgi:flagellin-like hook-associated protein FlgL
MAEISLSSSIRTSLVSLKSTATALQSTTERLSTGKKVASAIDNPTNYFAAQNYNDRATALSGRLDGMSEATEMINSADNGITNLKAFLSQMKGIVNDALSNTDSDSRQELGKQFNELIVQIQDMAKDSSYGGINLIYGNASNTVEFGEGIGDSTLKLQGFNISASTVAVTDDGELGASSVLGATHGSVGTSAAAANYVAAYTESFALSIDLNNTGTAVGIKSFGTDATAASGHEIDWGSTSYLTDLAGVVGDIESLETTLKTQSSKLANNLAIITQRQEFTETAVNILQEGADNLTLADLNEEGANLLSLQTSQSLGVKSLTLASNQASSVLSILQ